MPCSPIDSEHPVYYPQTSHLAHLPIVTLQLQMAEQSQNEKRCPIHEHPRAFPGKVDPSARNRCIGSNGTCPPTFPPPYHPSSIGDVGAGNETWVLGRTGVNAEEASKRIDAQPDSPYSEKCVIGPRAL